MMENKEYWKNRYQNEETGWDVGEITTPIKEYVNQIKDKSIKILIPGAGNGYEFEYLINSGFTNVYVLDIVENPLENIKKRIPHTTDKQLICDDFFNHNQKYDLILEQTFFCALNPSLREQYVSKMYDLLHNNGKLVGLLFQFPFTKDGPPFGGSKEEYIQLFASKFEIKTLETAYNSIKPRQNNELFFIFTKK